MTTNLFEVFNGVLKGARNLPITALVQLTFYRVNSYFTVRREHGASDSSLAAEVAMAPFDSGFDSRQRRHLIRAQLVSQLIRVQLVLLD